MNEQEYALIIKGQRVTTDKTLAVINPATADVFAHAPSAGEADINHAVAAAHSAFSAWSTTSDSERKAACHQVADVLDAHAEELAHLLTQEQGKPLNGMGSRFELGGCAAWTRYNADADLPVEVVQDDANGRIEVHRKPLGVVASVTPWNWPLLIAIWHIIPAIRTGNTVVIKPSPYTPLSTLRMVELMNTVLPAGVVNAVCGEDDVAPRLTTHPQVAKVTFTGSTVTGRQVMACAADSLKRLTLELGGNDAGIVLPDVDPQAIAENLFWGAFINNGQTCAAMKRLYVHADVYDSVCEALVDYAATVPMGTGLNENNVLGPIQNKQQYEKVTALVEDARQAGARILIGGEASAGEGYFYPITLIAAAKDGMRIVDEEQFGPVLPIIAYSDIDDALARANASDMGLGGSVWSADAAQARELAKRLECGTAWVNSHGGIQPNAPFGGVKQSGFGVEFGIDGLKEFTSSQTIFCG